MAGHPSKVVVEGLSRGWVLRRGMAAALIIAILAGRMLWSPLAVIRGDQVHRCTAQEAAVGTMGAALDGIIIICLVEEAEDRATWMASMMSTTLYILEPLQEHLQCLLNNRIRTTSQALVLVGEVVKVLMAPVAERDWLW